MRFFAAALVGLAISLSGCAPDRHAPPFAQKPYEAFSRTDAVAVAMDEWRLFGMRVDDNDDAGYMQTEVTMAERQPGLWQRIGEYWWEGLNANDPDNRWTGKHDANGEVFSVAVNGQYAWSAAFISYVMRIAGAGRNFPYAADHAYYINYAARAAQGEVPNPLLIAENPQSYAPRLGDLVCFGRGHARSLTFADLPTAKLFPAHCSIVVEIAAQQISVVGGNVEDAVTMTHVPTNQSGLVGAPWMVVLRVMYLR
ncbi:MAG: hypothetical protein B7Z75_06265 [Acidocella sp. 20-57-95]|nr:MAG: hypothetical protein B7Z75_06265 [Acidocella sp. 20-57-95]OYV57163.1 MAG: hypothetical protein B7Z71_12375 [Acidocella sp. 21-58-7]HQT63451.1 DUF2272 domain-containing protein [Acidocella sp.]HQU04927.1 DUF2272 domain-containing protein [Acidocella sp.]